MSTFSNSVVFEKNVSIQGGLELSSGVLFRNDDVVSAMEDISPSNWKMYRDVLPENSNDSIGIRDGNSSTYGGDASDFQSAVIDLATTTAPARLTITLNSSSRLYWPQQGEIYVSTSRIDTGQLVGSWDSVPSQSNGDQPWTLRLLPIKGRFLILKMTSPPPYQNWRLYGLAVKSLRNESVMSIADVADNRAYLESVQEDLVTLSNATADGITTINDRLATISSKQQIRVDAPPSTVSWSNIHSGRAVGIRPMPTLPAQSSSYGPCFKISTVFSTTTPQILSGDMGIAFGPTESNHYIVQMVRDGEQSPQWNLKLMYSSPTMTAPNTKQTITVGSNIDTLDEPGPHRLEISCFLRPSGNDLVDVIAHVDDDTEVRATLSNIILNANPINVWVLTQLGGNNLLNPFTSICYTYGNTW
jgi:hypothetical protein